MTPSDSNAHELKVELLKAQLRKELRTRLNAIPAGQRLLKSRKAAELLVQQRVWNESKSILLYAALPEELDLGVLFTIATAADKLVAFPRYNSASNHYEAVQVTNLQADLRDGRYGIPEPVSKLPVVATNALDFALVPGLGFDKNGHRLGRGKGYYDRLLAQTACWKCGVGYDFQVVASIPRDTHDVVLNSILTPERWLELNQSRF